MVRSQKLQKGRVSLERALSKLGIASRTEARQWILEGKVKVHGTVELKPERQVNPDRAHIEVVGQKVQKTERRVLLLHKPVGYLTTKRDPEGRKTIYDLLPSELQSLHPVGRLDLHTSGLLILTNDTRFSSYLTDPQNAVERVYVATVRGQFLPEVGARAKAGVLDDGELLQVKDLEIMKVSQKESKIRIVLTEGKNREVRRLCLALGHEVISLKRIRYGAFELGNLAPGAYCQVDVAGIQFNDRI